MLLLLINNFMKNIEFYKEFYFKEIDRKNELNNLINIPILVVTTIISINFFLFSQKLNCNILLFGKFISIINLVSVLYTTFYLLKSFSNFFKTHRYKELTNMNKILNYENELNDEQENESDADYLFLEYLKTEFADCATHNFLINKTRTEDIAKSKKGIFISIIITLLFSIIYIISISKIY